MAENQKVTVSNIDTSLIVSLFGCSFLSLKRDLSRLIICCPKESAILLAPLAVRLVFRYRDDSEFFFTENDEPYQIVDHFFQVSRFPNILIFPVKSDLMTASATNLSVKITTVEIVSIPTGSVFFLSKRNKTFRNPFDLREKMRSCWTNEEEQQEEQVFVSTTTAGESEETPVAQLNVGRSSPLPRTEMNQAVQNFLHIVQNAASWTEEQRNIQSELEPEEEEDEDRQQREEEQTTFRPVSPVGPAAAQTLKDDDDDDHRPIPSSIQFAIDRARQPGSDFSFLWVNKSHWEMFNGKDGKGILVPSRNEHAISFCTLLSLDRDLKNLFLTMIDLADMSIRETSLLATRVLPLYGRKWLKKNPDLQIPSFWKDGFARVQRVSQSRAETFVRDGYFPSVVETYVKEICKGALTDSLIQLILQSNGASQDPMSKTSSSFDFLDPLVFSRKTTLVDSVFTDLSMAEFFFPTEEEELEKEEEQDESFRFQRYGKWKRRRICRRGLNKTSLRDKSVIEEDDFICVEIPYAVKKVQTTRKDYHFLDVFAFSSWRDFLTSPHVSSRAVPSSDGRFSLKKTLPFEFGLPCVQQYDSLGFRIFFDKTVKRYRIREIATFKNTVMNDHYFLEEPRDLDGQLQMDAANVQKCVDTMIRFWETDKRNVGKERIQTALTSSLTTVLSIMIKNHPFSVFVSKELNVFVSHPLLSVNATTREWDCVACMKPFINVDSDVGRNFISNYAKLHAYANFTFS